jgi:hypothetical protein
MSPIRRWMKKRNPSGGQNGQLVHWWLLIHSAPSLQGYYCVCTGSVLSTICAGLGWVQRPGRIFPVIPGAYPLVHTHWVSWEKGGASVFKNETAEGVSIAFFKMPTLRWGKIMAATCPPITLWESAQDLPRYLCANGKCKH